MHSALFAFRTLLLAVVFGAPMTVQAQLTEHFNDVTTLSDWYFQNNSNPKGNTGWFQGNTILFDSYDGEPDAYIAADFNSADGVGTISNWMLTPELVLQDGAVFSFFTRVPGSVFPDRLELRLSRSGSSRSVGNNETSFGDFESLLLTVNPNLSVGEAADVYPVIWTKYSVRLDGIVAPTTGRFGFRYFVNIAEPPKINGDYIGIDAVSYSGATVVPEPASVALMAVGLFGLAIVRRRRAS